MWPIACYIAYLITYTTEKDVNNEVLWVWSYPGVDGGLRDLLMRKCTLDKEEGVGPYSYGHHLGHWYYLKNFSTNESEKLPKVKWLKATCQFSNMLPLYW